MIIPLEVNNRAYNTCFLTLGVLISMKIPRIGGKNFLVYLTVSHVNKYNFMLVFHIL